MLLNLSQEELNSGGGREEADASSRVGMSEADSKPRVLKEGAKRPTFNSPWRYDKFKSTRQSAFKLAPKKN